MKSVGSLSVLLAIACVALALRHAQAQLDGLAMRLGAQAMAFPGTERAGARSIRVNGVELSFRTSEVDAPLSEVLAHYETVCSRAYAVTDPFAALLSALATRSAQTDRDGYVACVALGSSALEELAARVSRFVDTGDLAELGPLRYAYARRVGDQAHGRTFLFALWSESSVRLGDLVPNSDSDAPGFDPEGVARPSGAQRILSAAELSSPSSVHVYLARRRSPLEVARSYRESFASSGWRLVERDPGEVVSIDGQTILSARRDPRLVTVIASPQGADGTNIVVLDSWGGS